MGAMSLSFFDQTVNNSFFIKPFLLLLDFPHSKLDCSKMIFQKLDYGCELKSLLDQTVSNYCFK